MKPSSYVRIGTYYYKIIHIPTIYGIFNEVLKHWNYETLARDIKEHNKDVPSFIKEIAKFDSVICIPSHVDYCRVHGKFYNIYSPLSYKPTKGRIDNTLKFLEHVFGKQLELALDYIQLLYLQPTQILPILCLVSNERQTGKTTFLKWLKEIFCSNMTYLDNSNLGNRFNSDWVGKLIIGVEEAGVNNDVVIEMLKNLSTANRYQSESKGKDRIEVDFFGKFILCSNNETDLIRVDKEEIRFWIVKVPGIPKSDLDIYLLDKLKAEIPAFLNYLIERPLETSKPLSRMWFSPKQLETQALRRMRLISRSKTELDLATALYTAIEDLDLKEIKLTATDTLHILGKTRSHLSELRKILRDNWDLGNQSNSNSYERLHINDMGYHLQTGARGRYYTISKEFLESNFDELMS